MERYIYRCLTLCAVAALSLTGCYYDVEEELYPNRVCNTEGVSYQQDIAPVFAQNCGACHSAANAPVQGAGIVLDTYQGVKSQVDFERLLGSLRRDPGFSPMPQGQPALPECTVDRIAAWIADGAPNN